MVPLRFFPTATYIPSILGHDRQDRESYFQSSQKRTRGLQGNRKIYRSGIVLTIATRSHFVSYSYTFVEATLTPVRATSVPNRLYLVPIHLFQLEAYQVVDNESGTFLC